MPYLNLLLAAGQHSLHFYKVESNRFNARYKVFGSKFNAGFRLLGSRFNAKYKFFGSRFAARDEFNGVHVLEIYYVGHAVRTTRLAVIHQNSAITHWQLWRDKLICILSSGDICVYILYMNPVQEIYRSQCYTDILYKNPIWTFRDIVFVSSLESSVFDDKRETPSNAYSYMSDIWAERNGSGHWYIGSLDQESENRMFNGGKYLQIDNSTTSADSRASTMYSTASRASNMSSTASSAEEDWDNLQGYCLQRQYLGSSFSSDITCVFLSRSLLLCGTQDGRLLLFQVPTSNLVHSSTDFESLGGSCVWNMNVSHLSIKSVHLNFSGGYIEMYFTTLEELSCVKLQSGAFGYNVEPLLDISC
ncbi:uncharacterized protein LOC111714663 [Eurytemora carolleeae]|uniref:uncharacterized protein LOC111714663 n=1 Tax=Eurytemora carolleeae TaxID=1294199 RepID=UPI000C763009|nr:uncharacterized protein LOC111714663 [Eurytemora carolleeae]|eukprot:XP_023345575.1 uncharacterized protein LOC111714663 [Eurytemora affinis]